MNWAAAIERNSEALKGILAALLAMAGLGAAFASPSSGAEAGATPQPADIRPPADQMKSAPTLPRHRHRAVLRLLRPAESAARRLIIVLARGIVVTLPPQRLRQPKAKPTILRHGSGTGIILPGGGSPLRARVAAKATKAPALPLLDPLPRPFRRRRPASTSVPRLSIPGRGHPFPVAPRRPPAPDDPVSAARLLRRLAALAAALADLPGQANRFARWRARRDHALAGRRVHRLSPLRPGRAYGIRRPRSRRPAHEVDAVLGDLHYFAHCALDDPDTS